MGWLSSALSDVEEPLVEEPLSEDDFALLPFCGWTWAPDPFVAGFWAGCGAVTRAGAGLIAGAVRTAGAL